MTTENFDRLIERRGTGCTKWDHLVRLFGSDDLLSLWVADMDWPSPDVVIQAMRRRLDHPIFGYTSATGSLVEAIVDRLHRRFGWEIRPEWVVMTRGVVTALHSLVRVFTHPGDEVIIQPPVYYPFYSAVQNCGCRPIENTLVLEDGRYRMDFDALEAALSGSTRFPARAPRARMCILCSPHNPVGRVWTPEELRQLADICLAHDCILVSDEIHADIVLDGFQHTVAATLGPRVGQGTITLMSASKTFNLAGLDTSFAIIPNPQWRRTFLARHDGQGSNIFGLVALEAAFRHGDDYVAELLRRINANMAFFIEEVERRIPPLSVVRPEGTYLAWVDARALGLTTRELQTFVRRQARLAVDDGFAFGPGGEGFLRVNVACPRSILAKALDRLEEAVRALRSR